MGHLLRNSDQYMSHHQQVSRGVFQQTEIQNPSVQTFFSDREREKDPKTGEVLLRECDRYNDTVQYCVCIRPMTPQVLIPAAQVVNVWAHPWDLPYWYDEEESGKLSEKFDRIDEKKRCEAAAAAAAERT